MLSPDREEAVGWFNLKGRIEGSRPGAKLASPRCPLQTKGRERLSDGDVNERLTGLKISTSPVC